MLFRFDEITPAERYKLLTAAVVPRPVAWVTSLDANGLVNAAPYSFFNVFSEDPALVVLGIERRPSGAAKDTVRNIAERGVFTVNIADEALAPLMVATAAGFPEDVSEPEALGLALAPGSAIDVPRIRDAPVSLECRRWSMQWVNERRVLVVGEIVALVAREGLFDPETKRIDFSGYRPVARLYAARYARLGEIYELPIPDWREAAAGATSKGEGAAAPAAGEAAEPDRDI